MGVFESFMALMEEAAIKDRERKGRARDMMKKYSPALFLMAAYKNLNSSKVPASFRGLPAMLVYIGMISMAVYSLGSSI